MAQRDEKCPNCGSTVSDGDIICIACGTNLLTGQQILEEKHRAAEAAPRNYTGIIVGAGILVAIVAVVGFLLWAAGQDPKRAARQHYAEGNPLDGINVLREYVENGSDDSEAFKLLGQLYLDAQRYAEAADAFNRASELDPGDADKALLTVFAATQERGQAGRNRQIAALRRVVEHHPNHEQAWMLLALALGANGDYSSQEEALERVIALGDSSGKARFQLGIARALQGNYEGANSALQEALNVQADKSDVHATQGILANLQGNPDIAAAKLQQAIDAGNGSSADVQAQLGLLYMTEGQFNKALPLLRPPQGQEVSPAIQFFYGLCLQTLGLEQEASDVFQPLASKDGPYSTESAIQMAMISMNGGNLSQAQDFLRRATSISGGTAKMHTLRGQIAMMQGDLADAQQSFRSAISTDPEYPAAHLENGLLYVTRGVLPEGLRELERYMELVGAGTDDPRLNEIDLLISQLRQTVGGESALSSAAVPAVQEI